MAEITQLLRRWSEGDREALDDVLPLVYSELRAIARRQLRGGGSFEPTELVHEFYLKVADKAPDVIDRGHLMALSAVAMRQLILSEARRKVAAKRGGGEEPVTFEDFHAAAPGEAQWMIALGEALEALRKVNEEQAKTFECRYFAGYSEAETAEALGISLRTCQRHWNRARSFIRKKLVPDLGG